MSAASASRLLGGSLRIVFISAASPITRVTPHTSRICHWKAGSRRSFSVRPSLHVKKYTTDHEWVELDADGKIGTIGITNYASKALGDVVYVELPELDLEVSKGDSIGAVESVKSASDIMTPVSGKIVEANDVLQEKPGTINKGPEGEGWLAKIEVSNASELDELMSAEEYEELSKE